MTAFKHPIQTKLIDQLEYKSIKTKSRYIDVEDLLIPFEHSPEVGHRVLQVEEGLS